MPDPRNIPLPLSRLATVVAEGWSALFAAGAPAASLPESAGGTNWLADIVKPMAPAYRQVAVISLFTNILALAPSIYIQQVYDRVVFHAGLSTLQGLTLGMVLVIGFDFVLRQGRARLLQAAGSRIQVVAGRAIFSRLLRLPLRTLESRPAAQWQAVFRDIGVVRTLFAGPTALAVIDAPFLLLGLLLIISIAGPVAWILAFVIPAFIALAAIAGRDLDARTAAERHSAQRRDRLVNDLGAVRAEVKAQGLHEVLEQHWLEAQIDWQTQSLAFSRRADFYRDVSASMTTATTVVITVVGSLAILGQDMTMGSLIAANIIVGRIVGPISNLVSQWRGVAEFRQAKRRLDELFAMPADLAASAVVLPRLAGKLAVENVSFTYGGDEEKVLDGLRLQLGPGGLYGISGPIGCGKSTLLKVLRGLYVPQMGRVLLDDADIGQFGMNDVPARIGYLPQTVRLFAGSIRDNIIMGLAGIEDEALVEAARLTGSHDFVADLKAGYGTDVGEGGHKLSGGQRKLVALSRLLLLDPEILLLDEPTSELDPASADRIVRLLVSQGEQRTVVVATHSPALLSACTGVLVLQKGRLVLGGRPDEVLPKLAVRSDARTEPA
ncbi:MAG: peptidase domain-containing ABC transporter [Actinomycetota bacterium]